jgi:hypothetical protein
MKLVSKTEKDLLIKEIPYNLRKLFEFDPSYSKRIKFQCPVHTTNILYINNAMGEDQKNEMKTKLI